MHRSSESGNRERSNSTPSASGDDAGSAMHRAAERGEDDVVQHLISQGVPVNAKDTLGQYPLHYAAVFGREQVLLTLLNAKADVNCPTKQSTTPLHYAARNNHLRCVEILIQHGAEVNAKDRDLWTPLHYACFRGLKSVCTFLIEKGAGVNEKTKQGHTPLHLACTKGYKDVALLLLTNHADWSIINNHQATPLQLLTIEDIPVPTPTETLLPNISSLLNDPLFSDIIIKVDGIVYRAHKCILSARCKFFLDLLRQHDPADEFEFSEISSTTFKYFLEWIYTGSVSLFSTDGDSVQAMQLLSLAHNYALAELQTKCIAYIVKHLSLEVIPKLSEMLAAEPNAYPLLEDNVSSFMLQHFSELNSGTFAEIGTQPVYNLLSRVPIKEKPRSPTTPTATSTASANITSGTTTPQATVAASTAAPPSSSKATQPSSPSTTTVAAATTTTTTTTPTTPPPAKPKKLEGKNLKNCKAIISALRKHRVAGIFNKPVDPERDCAPGYFDLIKNPMDLGTIKDRVDKNFYDTKEQFCKDVRQVWKNAQLYNMQGSPIYSWSQELSDVFEKKWSKSKWEDDAPQTQTPPRSQGSQQTSSNRKRKSSTSQATTPKTSAQPAEIASEYPEPIPEVKPMTIDEKRILGEQMSLLNYTQLAKVVEIAHLPPHQADGQDIELDLMDFDDATLRDLERFVQSCIAEKGKETTVPPSKKSKL
ncbi:sister chromatid cohesion protein PDS5 [Pelomyxa schiedti]|nr:sister chromatid cohesion protein PDS5 [Pelomyxa schiedti]